MRFNPKQLRHEFRQRLGRFGHQNGLKRELSVAQMAFSNVMDVINLLLVAKALP